MGACHSLLAKLKWASLLGQGNLVSTTLLVWSTYPSLSVVTGRTDSMSYITSSSSDPLNLLSDDTMKCNNMKKKDVNWKLVGNQI